MYTARHKLAQYFLQCEDFRLSDYFFESALQISFKIRLDGRKKEAEGLYSMGLVCERRGDVASLYFLQLNQIFRGLYSRCYTETCNEWRGPSPQLSAWTTLRSEETSQRWRADPETKPHSSLAKTDVLNRYTYDSDTYIVPLLKPC